LTFTVPKKMLAILHFRRLLSLCYQTLTQIEKIQIENVLRK